jgi:hypothetical protein
MAGPVYYRGVVPLKDGVTLTTVIELLKEHGCDRAGFWENDTDVPPPRTDDEGNYYDWDDQMELTVVDGFFEYRIDMPDQVKSFIGDFNDFLDEVATKLASGGWISTEGEEPEQAEVAYGPDEISKAQAVLQAAAHDLAHATQAYGTAYGKFLQAVANAAA